MSNDFPQDEWLQRLAPIAAKWNNEHNLDPDPKVYEKLGVNFDFDREYTISDMESPDDALRLAAFLWQGRYTDWGEDLLKVRAIDHGWGLDRKLTCEERSLAAHEMGIRRALDNGLERCERILARRATESVQNQASPGAGPEDEKVGREGTHGSHVNHAPRKPSDVDKKGSASYRPPTVEDTPE